MKVYSVALYPFIPHKMRLRQLQTTWDNLAKVDPLWAILTWDDKRGRKWNPHDFFATGKTEIKSLMEYLATQGVRIAGRKALDFGCGAGRLTLALADYFLEVVGVDISPCMITLARKYNRHPDRCHYAVNCVDNLSMFPDESFDFIYCILTLQHIEPKYAKEYIKEFVRLLSPNGVLAFQLPSEPVPVRRANKLSSLWNSLKQWVKSTMPPSLLSAYYAIRCFRRLRMDMYGIKQEEVATLLKDNGGRIVSIIQNEDAGKEWVSFTYYVCKPV